MDFFKNKNGVKLHEDTDICLRLIHPIELVKLLIDDIIIIPPIQRPLIPNKIQEIISEIQNNNNNWLLSQGRISIGFIPLSNKYYILDGQHRLEALSELIH